MAVLPENARAATWADFMKMNDEPFTLTKADLRAALNAVDDWVNTNQAAYNLALPLPARTELSASQKARLLQFVVERRYIEGV